MHISNLHVDDLGADACLVHFRIFPPKLGIAAPLATSYSMPCDCNDGILGFPSPPFRLITVSHAPETTVDSISIHSSDHGLTGLRDAFVAAE